jgi:hypothetical protein
MSVARSDARRILSEKRESGARQREATAQQAVEIDVQQRVAGLRPGVPWYEIPAGVLPVVAMTQAARTPS